MSTTSKSFDEIVDNFHEEDLVNEFDLPEEEKSLLSKRLGREVELAKENRAIVEAQWIHVLRREKGNEIQKETEILLRHHEEEIKQKNKIIQTLYSSYNVGEDQYQTTFSAHHININALIDMHDDQLLSMEKKFLHQLKTIVIQNELERKNRRENLSKNRQKIDERIDMIQKEGLESEVNDKRDHQHLLQEIHNRDLEEINGLRVILESKIEDLDEQFEGSHGEYVQNTDATSSRYKQLTSRDKEARRQIEVKMKNIERVQSNFHQLRFRCNKNLTDTKKKHQFILKQKSIILNHYQCLKTKMNRFRSWQQRKLTKLSMNANTKKNRLKKQKETAERVLDLSFLNNKMEKDRERVMSFITDPHEKDVEEQAARMISRFKEKSNESVSKCNDENAKFAHYFERFWKKYNNVLLDALSLEQRENALIKERTYLKTKMKLLRDGVSIHKDVITSNNPLLVINGRVKSKRYYAVNPRVPTIVDANQIISAARMRETNQ